jgi:CBS domain-containing protein
MRVEDLMTRDVKSCMTHDSLDAAAAIMWEYRCGGVPVVDNDRQPVGFLTDRDICMAAYTQGAKLRDSSVGSAMARRLVTCKQDDDLRVAVDLMQKNHVRRLPVVDSAGRLVGLLSLDDLARASRRRLRGGKNDWLSAEVAEVLGLICEARARVRQAPRA